MDDVRRLAVTCAMNPLQEETTALSTPACLGTCSFRWLLFQKESFPGKSPGSDHIAFSASNDVALPLIDACMAFELLLVPA